MAKTKNFSFSDFMSFSESLVDSLEAVSTKIEEVTNQITTLENVLEGDASADADANAATEEAPVSAEENVADTPVDTPTEEPVAEEVTEEVSEEVPADADTPVAEDVPADEGTPETTPDADAPAEASNEEPVSEEENDSAAIDAMSTGDENFSDKFMVVGLKNRPWGNRVIKAKDFSENEHNKLIPTLFSTQAQAQRALTSYNVNGANFSIGLQHSSNIVAGNSESKIINASESRYQQVKNIFNMN